MLMIERKLDELKQHTHPFKGTADVPMNIVNGRLASDQVNVMDTVTIGKEMVNEFERELPSGFYKPLKKKVITLETIKKGVEIGDKTVYDMENLYGCMLVVSQQRKLDLEKVFAYELAPMPFSLFDEFDEMCNGNKAVLVSQRAIFTPSFQPDVTIIDGNAKLYYVTWPKSGTVSTFANNFLEAVKDNHEVLVGVVVFNQYMPDSIKTHERERRASGISRLDMKLEVNTPLPA